MNNPFSSWEGFDIESTRRAAPDLSELYSKFATSYVNELDESVLACLAAGVPIDCIEIIQTQPSVVWQWDKPCTISCEAEIKFKYKL